MADRVRKLRTFPSGHQPSRAEIDTAAADGRLIRWGPVAGATDSEETVLLVDAQDHGRDGLRDRAMKRLRVGLKDEGAWAQTLAKLANVRAAATFPPTVPGTKAEAYFNALLDELEWYTTRSAAVDAASTVDDALAAATTE